MEIGGGEWGRGISLRIWQLWGHNPSPKAQFKVQCVILSFWVFLGLEYNYGLSGEHQAVKQLVCPKEYALNVHDCTFHKLVFIYEEPQWE